MDLLESFPRHQDIDVLGESAVPMLKQGHSAGDTVRDAQLVQAAGDSQERFLHSALALEKLASLAQGPPRITIQELLESGAG